MNKICPYCGGELLTFHIRLTCHTLKCLRGCKTLADTDADRAQADGQCNAYCDKTLCY